MMSKYPAPTLKHIIAQDVENTLEVKNPIKEKMTDE